MLQVKPRGPLWFSAGASGGRVSPSALRLQETSQPDRETAAGQDERPHRGAVHHDPGLSVGTGRGSEARQADGPAKGRAAPESPQRQLGRSEKLSQIPALSLAEALSVSVIVAGSGSAFTHTANKPSIIPIDEFRHLLLRVGSPPSPQRPLVGYPSFNARVCLPGCRWFPAGC